MSDTGLLHTLVDDLRAFSGGLDRVLTNERDFQVRLAIYLHNLLQEPHGHYDFVEVEYAIPITELGYCKKSRKKSEVADVQVIPKHFPWANDIYSDIVVGKNGKYAIVELKYATRIFDKSLHTSTRFGQKTETDIIKTQGARDIVMYNYCKDIRRIEHLSEKYENLEGGVALLITNNHLYWNRPKSEEVAYRMFSTHEGNVVNRVEWKEKFSPTVVSSHPGFTMTGTYVFRWNDTLWDKTGGDVKKEKAGCKFRYLLTVVNQRNNFKTINN